MPKRDKVPQNAIGDLHLVVLIKLHPFHYVTQVDKGMDFIRLVFERVLAGVNRERVSQIQVKDDREAVLMPLIKDILKLTLAYY